MNTTSAFASFATSTSFEHPSLNLLVTDAQRDRAIDYLQAAYADGRLSAVELDERLGRALAARTRRDLNASLDGLMRVSPASLALAAHPAYQPLVNQHRDGAAGRFAAGSAHFSSLMFPLVGPGVVYAVCERNTFAKRQAARAFNFQLNAIIAAIALGILGNILGVEFLSGVWTFVWFALTVVGGIKAFGGDDWQNPLMRSSRRWRPLDESTRRSLGR